jgi:hypothetical protein
MLESFVKYGRISPFVPKAVSGPGITKPNPHSYALTDSIQDSMKVVYKKFAVVVRLVLIGMFGASNIFC